MKQKLKEHWKNKWMVYTGALFMIVLIAITLYWGYELWHLDITIPMEYNGGDDTGIMVDAKLFQHQGWMMDTDRLGAPYSANFSDFTSSMMHNVGLLVLKMFVLITNQPAVAVNLTFLSIFFLAGVVSYLVMIELNISPWIASLTSAVFGVSPYMVMRGINHIVLTECYFVPLSILICFWIYERDDVLTFKKGFFKNPRNYWAVLFMLLIANNGIAYYPFFTCFLLVVTAVSKLLKGGKFKEIYRPIVAIGGICFFVIISIIPGIMYNHANGVNTAAVVRGGFFETELYGLKIMQLFMPASSHGIGIIQRAINKYEDDTLLLNENCSAFIGYMAILGMLLLLLAIFIKRKDQITERLGFLAEMNLMLILLGTASGFGTMFAFLISDMLRAYNRISIFIEYVCLLGFALFVDYLYKKYAKDKKIMWLRCVMIGLVGLIAVGSLLLGFPEGYVRDYDANKEEYLSDGDFVAQIESSVGEGGMIYQLPYHEYPEGGPVNDMMDYDLYAGFIHSDTLRWSYSAIKGRQADQWNKDVSETEPEEMIAILKDAGFNGIYIDRRAYAGPELNALEATLQQLIGHAPIVSRNENLSFFQF